MQGHANMHLAEYSIPSLEQAHMEHGVLAYQQYTHVHTCTRITSALDQPESQNQSP
jgi:hypothetical protein